jgi:hypothetical protein
MTNKPTRIVLACDESGAKGHADKDEEFPGQVGVFAGVMVPEEHLRRVAPLFQAIVTKYQPEDGKLHIANLYPEIQEALRHDVYDAIRTAVVPCFWYAVHVAGFHKAYLDLKAHVDEARSKQRSRIKFNGRSVKPPSLHVELFEGLYGNLIAFCQERGETDLAIEVRMDNVDSPIVRNFDEVARGLLDFGPKTTRRRGFDPATRNVYEVSIRTQVKNPEALGLIAKVHELKLNAVTTEKTDGPVLAADVLANSLAHLFHNRSDDERYRALNRPEAIAGHPLARYLDSFRNWGEYSFPDTFYRHPKDTERQLKAEG